MKDLRRVLGTTLVLLLAAAIAFTGCSAVAPTKKAETRDKLGIGFLTAPAMTPVYIAKKEGFFEKNGLDAELVYTQGGSTIVAGAIAGDFGIAVLSGPSVLESALRGSDMVMLAGVLNVMNYELVGAKNIKTADDLKGQKVGVLRPGDGTDFAARYALARLNLKPEKDVAIVAIGDQNARFAAVEAGAVQAAVMQPPFTLKARRMGYNGLVDLADIGSEYQQTVLATTKSYLNKNEATIRKFVKAWTEAVHFYKTDKEASTKYIGEYLKTENKEEMEDTWTFYSAKTPATPYVSAAGVKAILQEMSASNPTAAAAKADDFFDNKYVKELEDNGFIKALYGK